MTTMDRRRCPTNEDLDEVEVQRFTSGDSRTLPLYRGHPLRAEVVEALRRLAGRGLTDREVSVVFHGRMSPAAVLNARLRHGIPPGVPCTNPRRPQRSA